MPYEDQSELDRLHEANAAFQVLSRHMLLGRLNVLLEAAHEIAYSTLSERYLGSPARGSPMAADVAAFSEGAVGNVGRVCGVWHVVAAEALQAVASAHTDGRILFAPGPLLRSVMEHASRIGWVLDGATAQEKAARSWLAQVVANGEVAHTHRNAGSPTPTLAGAPRRLEELCEQTLPASSTGSGPTERDDDRPSGSSSASDGVPTPMRWCSSSRTMYTSDGGSGPTEGSSTDSHRCSPTHPRPPYSLKPTRASPAAPRSHGDWHLTRTRSIVALASFQSATDSLYSYLGWDAPAVAAWTEHLSRFVRDTAAADEDESNDA